MSGEAEPPEAINVVNFVEEAQQSLDEVRYAISAGWISEKLASTCERTYLNVTTLEGEEFCVRLSWRGFEVSELAGVVPYHQTLSVSKMVCMYIGCRSSP